MINIKHRKFLIFLSLVFIMLISTTIVAATTEHNNATKESSTISTQTTKDSTAISTQATKVAKTNSSKKLETVSKEKTNNDTEKTENYKEKSIKKHYNSTKKTANYDFKVVMLPIQDVVVGNTVNITFYVKDLISGGTVTSQLPTSLKIGGQSYQTSFDEREGYYSHLHQFNEAGTFNIEASVFNGSI